MPRPIDTARRTIISHRERCLPAISRRIAVSDPRVAHPRRARRPGRSGGFRPFSGAGRRVGPFSGGVSAGKRAGRGTCGVGRRAPALELAPRDDLSELSHTAVSVTHIAGGPRSRCRGRGPMSEAGVRERDACHAEVGCDSRNVSFSAVAKIDAIPRLNSFGEKTWQ